MRNDFELINIGNIVTAEPPPVCAHKDICVWDSGSGCPEVDKCFVDHT